MEDNNKNKNGFVPSYIKQEEVAENTTNKNDNSKDKKKSSNNSRKRLGIITIIFIVVILVLVIFFAIKIYSYFSNMKYNDYKMKMDAYGYNILYNNEKSTSSENLTKSEALKVVIGTVMGKTDISDLYGTLGDTDNVDDLGELKQITGSYEAYDAEGNLVTVEIPEDADYTIYEGTYDDETGDIILDDENEENNDNKPNDKLDKYTETYKNQIWVDYAVDKGIIATDDVNKDNAGKKATFMDVLKYLEGTKKTILNMQAGAKEDDVKDMEIYTNEEQLIISDLLKSKALTDTNQKLNAYKDATKGKVNMLLVNFMENNNLMTYGGKININKEKEPSNKSDYPYTLANIDKSVYEVQNYIADKKNYKTAKQLYSQMRAEYSQIEDVITTYFNTILNIDYNSPLTEDSLDDLINLMDMTSSTEYNEIYDYFEYVKTNEIKLTGTSSIIFPAIYYDGNNYRVRVKVEYTVENAKDYNNLILGDYKSNSSIGYEKSKKELLLDVPLNKFEDTTVMSVVLKPISEMIAGQIK